MADTTVDCENPSSDCHVLRRLKCDEYGTAEEDKVEACFDWIVTEFLQEPCQRPSGYACRGTSCNCMSCLGEVDDEDEDALAIQHAVAVFLVTVWLPMKSQEKQRKLNKWFKFLHFVCSKEPNSKLTFMLPYEGDLMDDNDTPLVVPICCNGLLGLLDVGRHLWNTAIRDPMHKHGTIGKQGAKSNRGKGMGEIYESLHSFLLTFVRRQLHLQPELYVTNPG